LAEVEHFVRFVAPVQGIRSIPFMGMIVTKWADSKNIDLLVIVTETMDLAPLAACARWVQDRARSFSRGGDLFLADKGGHYLARTWLWKDCRSSIRASCDALH
jgi:hypothetical protein